MADAENTIEPLDRQEIAMGGLRSWQSSGLPPPHGNHGPVAGAGRLVDVELDATNRGRTRISARRGQPRRYSIRGNWQADELLSLTGVADSDGDLTMVPGRDTEGWPYVALSDRGCRTLLTYSSNAPPTEVVGRFDVAFGSDATGAAERDLRGTDGQPITVALEFAGATIPSGSFGRTETEPRG